MNKYFFTFLTLFITLNIYSQDISFVASAPENVQVGEAFELKFTLNNASASSFSEPDLSDFQTLGVSQYQSSGGTTIIINGKVVQQGNVAQTWVYSIVAKKAGSFTIKPAKVVAGGTTYSSKSITIKASGTATNSNDVIATTASSDLFIDVNTDKSDAYVGEQIIETARFYSAYDIAGFSDAAFPTFDGFWTKEIFSPTNIKFDLKTIKGKKYLTALWHQKVLIPQQTGKLKIGQYKVTCQTGYGFFGGEIKIALSNEKEITVKALPTADKPLDFTGAVGDFKFSANFDKLTANINEPLTLTVKLEGSGNFDLFDLPVINIPNSFEIYDPEESKNVNVTSTGVNGSRNVEYVIIPRAPGNFTIAPIQFSYFNPKSKKYVVLNSDSFKITVSGTVDSTATNYVAMKSDVENLGTDIQFISTNNLNLNKIDRTFYESTPFYLGYLISLILFLIIIFVKRRQIKQNANTALVKNKKANKVSQKRLKTAAIHLKSNNKDLFYEEVLKALWGYLSDKLTIPISELNRDNISENLLKLNIEQSVVSEFINILDQCEFARYSPASAHDTLMANVYEDASKIIGQFEQLIKV